MRDWCGLSGTTFSTPIKSVKVLWQTLEDGDLGDPALGVVNKYAPQVPAEDDHTNIVELKNGDSSRMPVSTAVSLRTPREAVALSPPTMARTERAISFGAGMCG